MPVPTRAREDQHASHVAGQRRPMSDQRKFRLRRTIAAAVVLLLLLLAIKLFTGGGDDSPAGAATPSPARPTSATTSAAAATKSSSATAAPSSAAKTSAKVVEAGDGKPVPVAIPGQDTDRAGRAVTFDVEVEGGLDVDAAQFAASVRSILSGDRGWEPVDKVHFLALTPEQIKSGTVPQIRVTLASPKLTDSLCAPLQTLGEVSCNQGGRAVINLKRWQLGVKHYDDLAAYRTYVINHEVGHGLGHSHATCTRPGDPAPVMVQQTHGLQGCRANPYPDAG